MILMVNCDRQFLLATVCLVLVDHLKVLKSSPYHLAAIDEALEDLHSALATMGHTARSYPLLSALPCAPHMCTPTDAATPFLPRHSSRKGLCIHRFGLR